jgi:subtilisin family serine protease
LVLIAEGETTRATDMLRLKAGVRQVTRSSDFGLDARGALGQLQTAEAVVFESLGVAIATIDEDSKTQITMAKEPRETGILAIEDEREVFAFSAGRSEDYWRGYADGVAELSRHLTRSAGPGHQQAGGGPFQDVPNGPTWGLLAIGADRSSFSGKNVRVCVLDTGFDERHSDYAARPIRSESFIPGVASAHDGNGHGTHCAGTISGPLVSTRPGRYGVAPDVGLYVGKVLDDGGSGFDGWILAGIEWAVRNQCHVVSMSLGKAVDAKEPPSRVFEAIGRRALRAGTLLIAAAGNESQRDAMIAPVGHPANCESIMAVAAVDENLAVAPFSCGASGLRGGGVDIAAPGVRVWSSYAGPAFAEESGTSMATPHVAGVAALLAEKDSLAHGNALWTALQQTARRLPLPARDVGIGLVQAP